MSSPNQQSVQRQAMRYRKTLSSVTRKQRVEQRKREVECAKERLREVRTELREARKALRAALRGPVEEKVVRYTPVAPGEEGYDELPSTFSPADYQGEVKWISIG